MQTNGMILEYRDSQNIAYILQSPQLFFSTGYKVLQSQEKNGFIKCTKVIHNGKDKLVYDISRYKTLESLLPGLGPEIMYMILSNLLDVVIEVKNNGFMQCENMAVTFDKVFVDCNNYKVYLIYIPINSQTSPDQYLRFENQLKSNIIHVIKAFPNLENYMITRLCENMKNPVYTVEALRASMNDTQLNSNISMIPLQENLAPMPYQAPSRQKKPNLFAGFFQSRKNRQKNSHHLSFQPETEGGETQILEDCFKPSMMLCGVNTAEKVELVIDKPIYLIGKKVGTVDGVIRFNNAISRMHCKIVNIEGRYFIVDVGSANGTFVNETRVKLNQQIPITPGDRVRLANSNFIIRLI